MKTNTLRLLCWLYEQEGTTRWVDVRELHWIVPEMTPGGLHSVLLYLQERKRIVLERTEGQLWARITAHGMKMLEARLPAVSAISQPWGGVWQAVIFVKPPAADRGFRALRRALIAARAVPLTRGVFLYPGELPESITVKLYRGYEGAVTVVQLQEWTFGSGQTAIASIVGIGDLTSAYSSISKEIDRLLIFSTPLIGLNHQQKLMFSSVFSRLYSALQSDLGLQNIYFPQEETGSNILFRLQKISGE
jgi:hypothetical protein